MSFQNSSVVKHIFHTFLVTTSLVECPFKIQVLLRVALLSVMGTMPAGKYFYAETSHGFFPCDIWRVSRGYHWVSQDFDMKKVVTVLMPWKPSGVAFTRIRTPGGRRRPTLKDLSLFVSLVNFENFFVQSNELVFGSSLLLTPKPGCYRPQVGPPNLQRASKVFQCSCQNTRVN